MLKYLFYTCIAILSLGQLTAVSKTGETSLYLFDPAIAGFSLVGLFYFLAVKKSLSIPRYFYFFLLFTVIAAMSLVYSLDRLNGREFLLSSFYLLRWIFYLVSAIVVFNMFEQNMLTVIEVVTSLILSGILITLAGFAQLIILRDFENLRPELGWDPHKNRLASTFFDPNFTGAYLVSVLILLFEFHNNLFLRFKDNVRQIILYSASVLFTVALVLTFSRSSWAMMSVVVLIYGVLRYRHLLLLAFLIAFLAYFAVPRVQTRISGTTDPADSAQYRFISWNNTLKITEDNLITGVGFNAYRYVQRDYGYLTPDTFEGHSGAGSDSSILFVLATTGLFGLTTFVLGLVFPVADYFFKKRKLNILMITLIGGLLVHSLFVNSLFYPQIMFLWSTMFGVSNYLLRT